ncbi:outer membrane lipid asymmetry maintenance protein MlaD [Limibaculum sp. M0105]|uniref:Outer membrane lipid asymmetry maintenance protein MlaD n=1 Tax=Thermohalobaculum xanthum TaxID=2753746 RepID=A0A8J7M4E6_9RHOB|nr:outer membrane lipid asymmetry maintenance protein MlaD [Thermohalobaculum xanthum]MBK0397988.1 outer membrane lipid asymmetry maintenance protein MlaD [Thermohalobaculum xanthum]
MASNTAETLIGAIVLAVAGGFLVYAANTADLGLNKGDGYRVVANFRKAEGIAVGGDVRIAGVKVGSITNMELNTKTYFAKLTLNLREGIEVPEDSVAKITSASLLGDSYIAIDPGGAEFMLADGDELVNTQSSVSVGDLIGRFIHGQSSE